MIAILVILLLALCRSVKKDASKSIFGDQPKIEIPLKTSRLRDSSEESVFSPIIQNDSLDRHQSTKKTHTSSSGNVTVKKAIKFFSRSDETGKPKKQTKQRFSDSQIINTPKEPLMVPFINDTTLLTPEGFMKAIMAVDQSDTILLRQMQNRFHPDCVNSIRDSDGNSLLMISIKKKLLGITAELLELGADPTMSNSFGCNAIHLACEEECSDFLELLLMVTKPKSKALIARNSELSTPLLLATKRNRPKNVILLLEFSTLVVETINLCGKKGECPLNVAAKSGFLVIVELLLIHKATPSECCHLGHSAITHALNSETLDLIYVIHKYTKPEEISQEARFLASLSKAVHKVNFAWLHYLIAYLNLGLERKEVISTVDLPSYPLARAVNMDNLELVQFLLVSGAHPDPTDGYGNTPLIVVVGKRKHAMARCLLEFGADPSFCNKFSSQTPMKVVETCDDHSMKSILQEYIDKKSKKNPGDKFWGVV